MKYKTTLKDGIPKFQERKYEINEWQLNRYISVLKDLERQNININVRNIMPSITLHNIAIEIHTLQYLRDNPK